VRLAEPARVRSKGIPERPVLLLKTSFRPLGSREDILPPQAQRLQRMGKAVARLPTRPALPREDDLLAKRLQPIAGNISELICWPRLPIEACGEVVRS
jgi:hypothetical protein